MAIKHRDVLLVGTTDLLSSAFSREWRVVNAGRTLAVARRHPRLRTSTVTLPDGDRLMIAPTGQSTVSAVDSDAVEIARITRRSWWGRNWDVAGRQFSYELVSHPRPRRWMFAVGGAPVAELSGSMLSYNRVRVDANIGVPLLAVLLGWHVIARPWEAAAEPAGLLPTARTAQDDVNRGGEPG